MPQAIAAAAITTGLASAFSTIPIGMSLGQFFFTNLAIASSAQVIGTIIADQEDQPVQQMKGRGVMFRSPVAPRQVVYGEAVVSGPIVFAASSGEDNRYLHLVIPLADHEVEAIDEVYFNGDEANILDVYQGPSSFRLHIFDANAPVTVGLVRGVPVNVSGNNAAELLAALQANPLITSAVLQTVGNGAYIHCSATEHFTHYLFTPDDAGAGKNVENGEIPYRIKKHLGVTNAVADADLVAEVPEWTNDHRLRGIAYIYVRLTWDTDVWPNGVPNIKARVRGKKTESMGLAYSSNWAWCIHDYLRTQHGFNVSAAEVDAPELLNAVTVSDEQVEYQPGLFHNRYEINGAYTLDRAPLDILSDLVNAGAGAVIYQNGQFHIHAGAAQAAEPVGLDVDDLRGPIRFQSHNRRQNLFNAIRGTFINPLDFYQQTDFPPITNATFEAEDGGEQIFADISLPFTDDVYAAQRLATIKLLEHRNATVIEWPAKIKGLRYRVWDVVPITVPAMGWTNKLFRVIDFNLGGLGGPDLVLQAYDPAVYAHDVNNVAAYVQPPVSSLPSPRQVLAPTDLTLYSGTDELVRGKDGTIISQIRADWYRQDGLALEDEVQYKESAAQTWITAGKTREQELLIGPVSDATLYDVRVRTINTLGVKSDWLEDTFHSVTGKAEVPPDPAGLAISVLPDGTRRLLVTAAKPLDFGGYIFRARAGSHATWDSLSLSNAGIDLHRDPITSQPWDTSQPPAGDYTFGVKMVDTSGNESTNAYIAEFSLGNNPQEVQAAIELQASIALTGVTNMASDQVFSKQEKQQWRIQWPGMAGAFNNIYAQAVTYGIEGETVIVDFIQATGALLAFLQAHGVFAPPLSDSDLIDNSLTNLTADYYINKTLSENRLAEYIQPGNVSKFLVVKESLQQGVSYPGWQSINSIDLHGQAISSVARTIRVAMTINIDVDHGVSLNDTIFSMGLRYRPTAVDPKALQREWKDISLHGFEKTVSISYEFDVYYDPAIVDSHFINLDCQVYTTGHTIFFNDRDVTASFHFV